MFFIASLFVVISEIIVCIGVWGYVGDDFIIHFSLQENINIIFFFSVPPSVRMSPASGQVTARKGGSVTLECKASGNPVPSIRWTRKVRYFSK